MSVGCMVGQAIYFGVNSVVQFRSSQFFFPLFCALEIQINSKGNAINTYPIEFSSSPYPLDLLVPFSSYLHSVQTPSKTSNSHH